MKKEFKSKIHKFPPKEYMETITQEYGISKEALMSVFDKKRKVRFIERDYYQGFEYKAKLNILSFGKFKLKLPFRVIAMPISVDASGYKGEIGDLFRHYKNKWGVTLILNVREHYLGINEEKFAIGKTLPSLEFENNFENFEEYMKKLRSSYRRRIVQALKKGAKLEIKTINPKDFDEKLHALYLQVLNKSDFPLETLPIEFFQNVNWKFDVFYVNEQPLAFVTYFKNTKKVNFKEDEEIMNFAFGGMEYKNRDEYDLYYNMLIHIIKQGINQGVNAINLGQTAEGVKQRLGAKPKDRYMIAFSEEEIITNLLIKYAPMLENKKELEKLRVFKIDKQSEGL